MRDGQVRCVHPRTSESCASNVHPRRPQECITSIHQDIVPHVDFCFRERTASILIRSLVALDGQWLLDLNSSPTVFYACEPVETLPLDNPPKDLYKTRVRYGFLCLGLGLGLGLGLVLSDRPCLCISFRVLLVITRGTSVGW